MKKLILLSLCLSLYFIGQGAVPTITGFSPTTGTIGTTVIITGTNFSTTPSNNIVYFGAVKATVSGSTSTKITLTVPAGAGSIVPISVTTGGLSAYSTASTTPTFNLINTPNLVPNYTLRNQAAGNMPTSVAIGDFNGDGIPDMASCSWESWSAYGKVSVFLGKGDGTFTTKPDVPAGNRPQCIVIGDLNGDGKADMAVANMNSYDISILLGNGDGTFTAAASLSLGVGYEPYKLTIGDINGDGIADIIAGGLNGNTNVNIFPGLGNGTFGTKISLAIGVEPYSIAIGDLNGDGKMDIVATNSKSNSNTISVLLGNGNGTFGTKTNFAISSGSGANPSSVVIGDFNGDGKADLATANSNENSVSVLLGDGNGSFGTATPYAIGNDPGSIVVGDFNGDGKTDLAACNYLTPSSVSILLGNGNGTFKPATNFPVGDAPGTIAIADFNNDGKADIATSNWTNNISILLYTTPPTITSFTPTSGGNGTTVTITGTNLTGATAVSFGGTAASSFTVVNATTVTAVVGSGTSGTISITTPGGTATGASDQFTYAAAPTVTGISPATGPVGTLVTITGTNLSYPTAFILGGVTAIAVSNDGTTLVGMVMPGAITGSVVVTTASGTATSTGTFTVTATTYPGMQQGSKLVGTVSNTYAEQGCSVSVSADGNTAIVGGFLDSSNSGAAWIYIRSGGEWIQQGGKLVGTGAIDGSDQGWSVSLSADGNTAIVGGYMDTDETGAAWVFTRLGGVWTQQGSKLVATGANYSGQGWSVSLSADGNTAIVGGYSAAWIYARSGGIWTQQGSKLLDIGTASNGLSVFISADGNTAIVGGCSDNSYQGAAWVYIRSGSTWTLQGNKLVGNGASGAARQGSSVSLSADGNTAIVGGSADNSSQGAAWVYTRSGSTWIQQGSKLVGTGNTGTDLQGSSVSLSGDGNTAMVGGSKDNNYQGAAWIYTRSGGVWTQKGSKLVGFGNKGAAQQGVSVSLSADGNTAIMGGSQDNSGQGAAWVFIPLATPTTQASAITCSSVQATQMNIGWTNGNGANRAVFVKAANTGTTIPVDNTTYSANTSFSSGSQIGSTGWYCVYNGTGTSVTITGLTAGTDYIAQVFEYNGTAGDEKYYTVPATDNPKIQKTLMGAPTVTGISPASGPTTGGTAVTITGTNLTVASAVMFGSTNATGYTVNSATQITAISPAGVAGATDVTITSAGGTSEIIASDKFTYVIPNSVPSDISLSSCTIDENVAANSTVGTLSSTDPDAGNAFTYTLVAGTGSTDNASFNINGNSLQITNSPDYETNNSYSVRVRTTDQGGLFFEKALTITINDVNETPTDIALSASSINENVAANSAVGTLSSTDPD
ncbi:MAG: FG-GAP-like repeat-containing protein, partial [Bacteroidota bacterium]|nr:FG-GAP-like repeat-containing protein [Bacteroidota bacterium]